MNPRLLKLKYRAWHRGFREADLVLGPFADGHLASLSAGELDAFEALLEEPDPDLWAWIIGQAPAPESVHAGLLERIRAFSLRAREPGR